MGKREIVKGLGEFYGRLRKRLDLKKVVFFGSRVNGSPKEDSDIDLIIVSDDFKGKKFRYRGGELYKCWDMDYAVDFLCFTVEEFERKKKEIGIVREAVRDGIEIGGDV